jgi:epoxyqueuosine reductase
MVCPLNRDNGDFNILGLTSEDLVISGEIDLLEAITLTKESFENKFENTPISRATYEMFLRNVIIAIGNSKSTQYSGILKGLLERVESSMIRCHAVWALGEINGQKDKEYLICLLMIEKDENVIREISWFIN